MFKVIVQHGKYFRILNDLFLHSYLDATSCDYWWSIPQNVKLYCNFPSYSHALNGYKHWVAYEKTKDPKNIRMKFLSLF